MLRAPGSLMWRWNWSFPILQAALGSWAYPALGPLEAAQQELSSTGRLEGTGACPPVP